MTLAGMGMGCLMPSTTKAILVWFPVKERATTMGLKQTAVNVGGIITAIILPTLALTLSWHYGFLSIGFIAIVIGIVSFILYKEPPQSISLNTLETEIRESPRTSVREVFRNRDIWLLIGAGMCLMVVEYSALAYLVLYLNETLLFTVVTAAFFLAILEVSGAFGKPISGLISDRLFHGSRKEVYIMMCCISFAACIIFAFLSHQNSSSWVIIPLCLILGFASLGWGGLHLTLVGEFAGKELAGTVTGMSTVFLMIANVIGPPGFGYIVDKTGSYRIAWQFLAIIGIVAAALLLFVREEKRKI
jgi:sugar phosphate permease